MPFKARMSAHCAKMQKVTLVFWQLNHTCDFRYLGHVCAPHTCDPFYTTQVSPPYKMNGLGPVQTPQHIVTSSPLCHLLTVYMGPNQL